MVEFFVKNNVWIKQDLLSNTGHTGRLDMTHNLYTQGFAMMLMKIFNTISSLVLAIASQKLVSQILLLYESLHRKRDIYYDKLVLIFFYEHHCKALRKKVDNGTSYAIESGPILVKRNKRL